MYQTLELSCSSSLFVQLLLSKYILESALLYLEARSKPEMLSLKLRHVSVPLPQHGKGIARECTHSSNTMYKNLWLGGKVVVNHVCKN